MNPLQLVLTTILLLTTSIPVSSGAVVRLRWAAGFCGPEWTTYLLESHTPFSWVPYVFQYGNLEASNGREGASPSSDFGPPSFTIEDAAIDSMSSGASEVQTQARGKSQVASKPKADGVVEVSCHWSGSCDSITFLLRQSYLGSDM